MVASAVEVLVTIPTTIMQSLIAAAKVPKGSVGTQHVRMLNDVLREMLRALRISYG